MSDSGVILVFDLGTTNFKATLFDFDGSLRALARTPTPFRRTRAPHSEVPIDAFEAALLELARDLQRQAPDAWAAVRAVTWSSQTNTFALLDAENAPLTPLVVWNDRRAADHTAPVEQLQALPRFYETTGVPGLSAEFMVAKLRWFQDQTPELWERAARIALISDYFTWRFTGEFITEAGAAGLTGLLDIHTLAWWKPALDIAAIDADMLPRIARAGNRIGTITPEAAAEFGLPHDCVFVTGCLDQYAGAIGAGNVAAGGFSETTGTVLATVRCADDFTPAPGSGIFWGPAADPGRYYQMLFGDVSGNLLEAFRNASPDRPDFDALTEAAAGNRLSLPHGLDTPALLACVRGWAENEPRGEAARAILQGVAHALAEQLDTLCGANRPAELHSVGGAARSRVWMQIKANTLGIPVRAVACPEPTSLGAALLAMRGLSGTPLDELAARCVALESPVRPGG